MPAISDTTITPASGAAGPASATTATAPDSMLFLAQLITMQGASLAQDSAYASVFGGEQLLPTVPPSGGHPSGPSEADGEPSSEAVLAALCLPAAYALVGETTGTPVQGNGDLLADVTRGRASTLESASQALAEAITEGAADSSDASAATIDSVDSSTHVNPAHLMRAASAGPEAAAPRELRAPVGTPAWTEELGAQLTWMAANGRESASLRLSPENLGPLEIRIVVRDGETSVWFGAAQADTRSAIEQSLPRLRELFESQGLVLADAGIHRDGMREQLQPEPARPAASDVESTAETTVTSVTLSRTGLIDTYA